LEIWPGLSLVLAQVTPTATTRCHCDPVSCFGMPRDCRPGAPSYGPTLSMTIFGDVHARGAVTRAWPSSRGSGRDGAKVQNLDPAIAASRRDSIRVGLWRTHSRHVASGRRTDGREIFCIVSVVPRLFSYRGCGRITCDETVSYHLHERSVALKHPPSSKLPR
jgi:hypothetical protein